jgi:hypothetical protein
MGRRGETYHVFDSLEIEPVKRIKKNSIDGTIYVRPKVALQVVCNLFWGGMRQLVLSTNLYKYLRDGAGVR